MIMAGAIGNLYDNFTEERGGVRDFLRFSGSFFGSRWEFPAFNVADSWTREIRSVAGRRRSTGG
jgi:lipoprotein signal peptidase